MRIRKFAFAFLFILCATSAMAQTTRTYTLQFEHDGVDVVSYAVEVDGVRSTITPAPVCTVVDTVRTCTSPIVLTYGVEHTVKVVAVGLFGEGVSLPFVCVLPKVPNNTKVGK